MCEALSNVGRLAVCETYLARDIFSQSRDPPTAFNPAAARMSEVALVDPIPLSKDRKKAPLSAPS
jgi:hypothetical protein